MARELDVELARYKSIKEWDPKIGDLIVKYGWISKVKWFGVINGIFPDGSLSIIKEGTLRLLVTTDANSAENNSIILSPSKIKNNFTESYNIIQQRGNIVVIFV